MSHCCKTVADNSGGSFAMHYTGNRVSLLAQHPPQILVFAVSRASCCSSALQINLSQKRQPHQTPDMTQQRKVRILSPSDELIGLSAHLLSTVSPCWPADQTPISASVNCLLLLPSLLRASVPHQTSQVTGRAICFGFMVRWDIVSLLE